MAIISSQSPIKSWIFYIGKHKTLYNNVAFCFSFWGTLSQNSLPGLCPWTPLGDLQPPETLIWPILKNSCIHHCLVVSCILVDIFGEPVCFRWTWKWCCFNDIYCIKQFSCILGFWRCLRGISCLIFTDLVKNADLMWKQSVWTSVIASNVGAHHLKEGGMLVLTGAQAALTATAGMFSLRWIAWINLLMQTMDVDLKNLITNFAGHSFILLQ